MKFNIVCGSEALQHGIKFMTGVISMQEASIR